MTTTNITYEKMTSVSFDSIIDTVGGLGLYQILLFILISIIPMFNVDLLYLIFMGYKQQHWCHISNLAGLPFHLQVMYITLFINLYY